MKIDTRFVEAYDAPLITKLDYFDIEVFTGSRWMSLNDHVNYIVGSTSLGETSQTFSKITSKSSMYDGEWVVHATKDNVNETIQVYVLGATHSAVEDNRTIAINAFTQLSYNIRVSVGNHVETWRCFPADYNLDRGHIMAHNFRETLTFSVPRYPNVVREIRQ